ncbi:hypothetical protein Leryth_006686 [Lithospermum erythrorhizon]|nr:hypothetical protein Leryth_006686 [Lithospermum erythrorhizon]
MRADFCLLVYSLCQELDKSGDIDGKLHVTTLRQGREIELYVGTDEIEHGEFVQIRTVFLNLKPPVFTLKQDLHYFPTWELRFNPQTAVAS